MEFPDVSENCMRHFVRGCWDGDGGFGTAPGFGLIGYYTSNPRKFVRTAGHRLIAHYTCGSERFIRRMAVELFKAGIVRDVLRQNASETPDEYRKLLTTYGKDGPFPPTIYKRKGANAFDLRIGSTKSLERLFGYLYEDVDSAIYLQRKFDRLRQFLVGRRGTHPAPA